MIHTVDATDKTVGRIASKVAVLLMGKDSPSFERNKVSDNTVKLINTSKAKINSRRLTEKTYARYSGYPGGLRHESMGRLVEKKGYSEVFKEAIYGMLPANKLRSRLMKKLIISE